MTPLNHEAQQQSNSVLHRCAYVGRFAPSPTGLLHFGSLITAFASYCDAKAHGGRWVVRIEDTDIPRIYPHSEQHILACLEACGFVSDMPIVFQKDRLAHYEHALQQLNAQNQLYACQCTRKQLGAKSVYQGTCRDLQLPFTHNAIRLQVTPQEVHFNDLFQGAYQQNLAQDVGDFVLKRRDGIISYQLAVVVDDYLQGVSHVLRGADLLDNTPRQIYLAQCLGYPIPQYGHLPLAMNVTGQKLSKQNLAKPIEIHRASHYLQRAAKALQQPALPLDTPQNMLKQAVAQWQRQAIPRALQLNGAYN